MKENFLTLDPLYYRAIPNAKNTIDELERSIKEIDGILKEIEKLDDLADSLRETYRVFKSYNEDGFTLEVISTEIRRVVNKKYSFLEDLDEIYRKYSDDEEDDEYDYEDE